MDDASNGHFQFAIYDLATKFWSSISSSDTNPEVILRVAGFVIKQMDLTKCDVVIISLNDKKMYICRYVAYKTKPCYCRICAGKPNVLLHF